MAGRVTGAAGQGAAGSRVPGAGAAGRGRHRQHADRVPPRPSPRIRSTPPLCAARRREREPGPGRRPRGALAAAEAGLALWEGALTGRGDRRPRGRVAHRRAPVRGTLVRGPGRSRSSRLGRHAEAVGPLAVAAAEHPRDEEVLAELLRCEAATAGPAAALARYEAYRRELRDELGSDPGAGLQAVHAELLRGEAPVIRRGVPHEPNPLLGRDEDIAAVAASCCAPPGSPSIGHRRPRQDPARARGQPPWGSPAGTSSASCISCRSPASPPTGTWRRRSRPPSAPARRRHGAAERPAWPTR